MSEPAPSGDPLAEEAQRRRHPAERRTSRYTGLLLLLLMTQGAFGYALVGLDTPSWVRETHFWLGLVAVGLAALVARSVRRLPGKGRRVATLRTLGAIVSAFTGVQLVLGLIIRGWIPAEDPAASSWHLGIGLFLLFFVAVVHVIAIGPSILLSARRERDRTLESRREGPPP